jgi:hypothetical protein
MPSDTALGDWYVNRLSVDRQPLLILVSSQSLLPILIPARDVRALPARLPEVVTARLKRLRIAEPLIQAEARAMLPVVVEPTVDRSVIGIMVDFAKAVPFYLDRGSWNESTLAFAEARLAETPCHAARRLHEVVFPDEVAPALLAARWSVG